MAKNRLERQAVDYEIDADFHLLNVVEDRPASSYAAETLGVHHESPQLIVVKAGEAELDQSHCGIQLAEVAETLAMAR